MIATAARASQKILKIHQRNPDPAVVFETIRVLNHGGLVVAPTETCYGLLARIDHPAAVERLFKIKGRSLGKPSAIFVPDISRLKELAEFTGKAQLLAEAFLPGPLTLVLKAKRDFGPSFTLNNNTGFRISSSPLIKALLEKTGKLTATSANLSGQKEPEMLSEIQKQFGDKIDLYLDAGKLNNQVSTVVQVIADEVTILREGVIKAEAIFSKIENK